MLSERIHGAVSIHTVVRKDIHTMKHLNIISEIIDKVNPLVGKTANKLIVPQKLAFFVGIDPVITVRRSGGVRNQVPKRGPARGNTPRNFSAAKIRHPCCQIGLGQFAV